MQLAKKIKKDEGGGMLGLLPLKCSNY